MIIFPLSWPGKIVLILIAIFLGMILSMFQWPNWWIKRIRKESKLSSMLKQQSANKNDKK